MSTEKIRKGITGDGGTPLGDRIRGLRKSCGFTQTQLAALLGVRQSAVARWEKGDDRPVARTLVRLSELANSTDRQWWRDQAAEHIGFEPNNGLGTFAVQSALRPIPLLKDVKQVAALGAISPNDVERFLQFPAEWFPEGGEIRAVRVKGQSVSDLLAMVDVSKRDADRLAGHMVAVQTPTGIEVRWLVAEGNGFILLPFTPGQPVRLLKFLGENSVIGLVRWVGDAPPGK